MNSYVIQKWERCKEIAADCMVTVQLRETFVLSDRKGLSLGNLHTVDEVYAFLCGYEHSTGSQHK